MRGNAGGGIGGVLVVLATLLVFWVVTKLSGGR